MTLNQSRCAVATAVLLVLLPARRAHAGFGVDDLLDIGESIVEAPTKVGKELERTWDKTKEELERTQARAEAELGRWQEDLARVDKEIGRVTADIADEFQKLQKVNKATKKIYAEVRNDVKVGVAKAEKLEKMAKTIDKAVGEGYGEIAPVAQGAANILGPKLAKAIEADKVNEFLNIDLASELRIVDLLLPVQAGFEHLDPTGTQQCIRENTISKGFSDGYALLSGSGEGEVPQALEGMATQVVASCILKNAPQRKPDPERTDYSSAKKEYEDRIQETEAEKQATMAQVEQADEEKRRLDAYQAEIQQEATTIQKSLKSLKDLMERSRRAKEELAGIGTEMDNIALNLKLNQ